MDHYTRSVLNVLISLPAIFFLVSCTPGKQAVVDNPGRAASSRDADLQAAQPDTKNSGLQGSGAAQEAEVRQAPVIPIKAGFKLENTDGTDLIRIMATGSGKNADQVTFQYEWTKNGEPAGSGDNISGFKRGDRLSVRITPFIGKDSGQSRTLNVEIKKTTAKLTESSKVSFDGKVLLYQVRAVSPDGDPITYELIDAPQGMEIDKNSGLIRWVIPENAPASQSVKVKMSDNSGGELIYPLTISTPR